MMDRPKGEPEVSRVQQAVIALVGAVTLLVAFCATMEIPPIPDGFLALIGASQAAYIGAKTLKQSAGKSTNA